MVEHAIPRRPKADCKAAQRLSDRRLDQNHFAAVMTGRSQTLAKQTGQAATRLTRRRFDGFRYDPQPVSWIQRKVSVTAVRRRIFALAAGGTAVLALLTATACGESEAVSRSMAAPDRKSVV